MASADKVPMLAEGHRKLSDELKRLRSEERPAIVEADHRTLVETLRRLLQRGGVLGGQAGS